MWVRIYGLAQEYWRPKILFAIASSVGTPLCTDAITGKPAIERTFGHFARVLVDMDLCKELKHKVLVERRGYAFFVELGYDNLPDFCSNCKMIGHSVERCRKLMPRHEPNNNGRNLDKEGENTDDKVEPINVDEEENKDTEQENLSPVKLPDKEKDVVSPTADINQPLPSENDMQLAGHNPDQNTDDSDTDFVENTQFGEASVQGSSQHPSQSQSNNQGQKTPSQNSPNQNSQTSQKTNQSQNTSSTHKSNTSIDTPIRIQNDMQFLQQSWANLEDQEDDQDNDDSLAEQQRIIDLQIAQEIQHNIDDSGFQLVTKRNKKKANKKVSPSTSKYATRSKVGHHTPPK